METIERTQGHEARDWYEYLEPQNKHVWWRILPEDLRLFHSQGSAPEEKMRLAFPLKLYTPSHLRHAHYHGAEEFTWSSQAAREAYLEQTFRELTEEWYKDTRTVSSVSRMVMHPSYLRIIGMGREAVPLLLRELERTRDHWLVALHATTGEDPAPEGANYDEAVEAWLAWGRREGYI